MLKYLRMGNKRIKIIWWILVVVTVVTFVGGFIFLFGSGFDTGYQAQVAGAMGTVDGEQISRADFQNAVSEQRLAYRQRMNAEPGEQESRMIEAQAWRGLVIDRVMAKRAKELGLEAHDKEVLISLQTSPPQVLTSLPDFQTNGQFDATKYMQALQNPSINWAPFEAMVRHQLPVRKLQERMVMSLKLSQPELMEAFRNRYQKIALTVVEVPAAPDSQVGAPSQAELDRAYDKYLGRFQVPASIQLELLSVPKRFSEEEMKITREQAQEVVNRARQGADFKQLVKDYSEDPGVPDGEINRLLQPADFGPELAPRMAAMQPGEVSDPIAASGRFMIIKCLGRIPDPISPVPNLRVARIVINVKASETTLRSQYDDLKAVRDRARSAGLARAATEKGLTTARTPYFGFGDTPPQLADAPELNDWGFGQKVGAISPLSEGADGFYLAQVAQVRAAGPAPKEEMTEMVRSIARMEARVLAARPRADQLMAAVRRGLSLEAAAQSVGLQVARVASMSREAPDQRLASAPEVVGAAFATPIGAVAGPLQTPASWLAFRVEGQVADTTTYENVRGEIRGEIEQRRQQEFMRGWVANLRMNAKIKDLRTP